MADDDPAARPRRRVFSAEYKLAILAEYDAAPEGAKGSILRQEGLYSSHVTEWRKDISDGSADLERADLHVSRRRFDLIHFEPGVD